MASPDDHKSNEGALDPIVPIDFTPNQQTQRHFSYRPHWLHAVIAGFLLLSLSAGWFVLTAKSVQVEVTPITAEVEIIGGMNFQLGQRYLIRPGSYQIQLSNAGYYDTTTQLLVGQEAAQTHSYTLRKLPGLVSVNTTSGEPARVRIDGVDIGLTPLAGIPVEPGEHTLSVTRDRYLDYSQAVTIEGRSVAQDYEVTLSPAWAVLAFATEPPGAEVLVDGELLGFTPLQAEILQGRREVTLKLAGHKAWQDGFDVLAGEDFEPPTIELEPADGLVFIRSNPTAASVTVNGEFRGLTPLEVALPPGRQNELTFFKNGYESNRVSLITQPNQERTLSVDLEPILASVSVVAQPADAELYVNGEFRGPANQTIELMAASQQIEIRKDGYVPYNTEFVSRPGLDQQIRVTLKSLEQARLEQIEPEITTVAGQRLKLFYPGAFTMGASRREPGRRSNETLRDIELERPFYFSYTEVTNGQYRRFDPEYTSGTVEGLTLNNEAQPVVRVTWEQAALYCNWLSEQEGLPLFYQVEGETVVGFNREATGYRLPSEAEWAWVARADDRGTVRKYPWGEALPPPDNAGNFADVTVQQYLGQVMFDYDDGYFASAPVGSFEANHHGVFDLAGNVSEWVHDFYGSTAGAFGSTEVDPLGPDSGEYHTIRGSSWAHGAITEMRLSFRDFGVEPRDDVGFRVARYLDE